MKQKETNILIGIALVAVGGVIGWLATARHYNAGPLAGLSGQESQADFMIIEGCDENRLWEVYSAYVRNAVQPRQRGYQEYLQNRATAWEAWNACVLSNQENLLE